jgi:hypothetical protein
VFKARCAAVAALMTIAVVAVIPSFASAATIQSPLDTAGSSICPWGYPDTATYGQTVVAPSEDTVLESFKFFVLQNSGPADITYRAFVYAWDGSKATGPSLWESDGPQTVSVTGTDLEHAQAITAQTGGVALEGGSSYVLFVSVSKDYASYSGEATACFAPGGPYDGGQFVFSSDFGVISDWTTSDWGTLGPDDLAFEASFSSWAFDGFYAPVNNKDAGGRYIYNRVKAGQAIPVKFSLGGDHGLDVFADGYPRSQSIACDSQALVDWVEETVNAGASSLSYAAGSDTYTYVWKTDKAWSDSCRQLVVRFDDGTTARANFTFTR